MSAIVVSPPRFALRRPGQIVGIAEIGRARRVVLERALCALPGWGSVTIRAFLRELRGVWPGADPSLDERTAAARYLELPAAIDSLRSVAAAAPLDARDHEAGLVRLALAHDLARCPGGEECRFAGSQGERLRE